MHWRLGVGCNTFHCFVCEWSKQQQKRADRNHTNAFQRRLAWNAMPCPTTEMRTNTFDNARILSDTLYSTNEWVRLVTCVCMRLRFGVFLSDMTGVWLHKNRKPTEKKHANQHKHKTIHTHKTHISTMQPQQKRTLTITTSFIYIYTHLLFDIKSTSHMFSPRNISLIFTVFNLFQTQWKIRVYTIMANKKYIT